MESTMNDTIITSCGVIRNSSKPRVGVMSGHSLQSWFFEDMYRDCIDLTYEEFVNDLREQGMSDQDIENETEFYECDESTYLFGSWKKNADGKYEIDKTGEFAGTYNSGTNIVCVEWSKHTKKCHHTSPCYMMANGDGPCGDLDTSGDAVIAYCLPDEYLEKRE